MENTFYIKNLKLLICSCNKNSFMNKRCLNCSKKAIEINLREKEKSLLKYKFSIRTFSSVEIINEKIIVKLNLLKNKYNKLTKKLSCREESKIIEINESNFLVHFKYLIKYLSKKKLIKLINIYNEMYRSNFPILIYKPLRLSLLEIYYLTSLMFKYPKLSNIQSYFEVNILLLICHVKKLSYPKSKELLITNFDLIILDKLINDKYINKRIDYSKNKIHQMLRISKEFLSFLNLDNNKNYLLRESKKADNNIFNLLIDNYNKLGKNIISYSEAFNLTYLYSDFNDFVTLYTEKNNKSTKQIISDVIQEKNNNSHNYYYSYNDDIVTYYRDYVRISKELGLEYKETLKDIKLRHDILTDKFNLILKLRKNKSVDLSKSYKKFNYEKEFDDFVFLKPNKSEDIIIEGYKLNHCVGSYVSEVYRKDCLIYFLRYKNNPEEPLVTIEVRNQKVMQAKGSHNRYLKNDELNVIKLWAEEFNLEVNKNI